MRKDRTLEWDWYAGKIPDNVRLDDTAYVETTFSFFCFRSRQPDAVCYGRGASTYLGTMFDVGPEGRVTLGDFALVHGAQIICDAEVSIGNYALISWNVVLMDSYRLPLQPEERRKRLEQVPESSRRALGAPGFARPIHIGQNVWIGFDSCILPGVSIGEGSIVGARSVVSQSVPPYTIVGGNPARIIRQIPPEERGVRIENLA